MGMKIALAGNPNCGKTTLFNALTGASQHVGNWPGVTVEKKEGKLRGHGDVIIQDLPGVYSLSPYTLEEVVTRDYLVTEQPDAILNIIDASNLERNLYLTTQLMELGLPVVIALNMMDVVRRQGGSIQSSALSQALGVPVIALIAGALFGGAWWVGPSAYFVGVAAIICSGIILKKTRLFAGDPAPFVMELPAYHWPSLKGVLRHMWERAVAFIKKAGTVIFLAVTLIWFLQTFNFRLEMVEQNESILASIGNVLAPIFAPLGWGDWRAAVAAISGLIAKENVVGTLGVLFGFAEVAEDGVEIWGTMQQVFTPVAAYSFLVFNLLCAPCFAAIGAVRRELGGKWTLIAVGYQCLLAYMVSLCIYQFGALLTGAASFGVGTVAAIIILVVFLYLLFRPQPKAEAKLRRAAVKA